MMFMWRYKLATVPTAMLTEDGMQIRKAQYTLKSFQVNIYRRNAGDADVLIIDGSALLWTIHWTVDVNHKLLTSYLPYSDVSLQRYMETGVNKKSHVLS